MKYKFGAIITDGYGKLGGQVLTRNHYGGFLKTKHTAFNPKSPRQIVARGIFKTVVSAWESLTDEQRLQWNAATSDYGKADRFGDIRILSGYNLFIKVNSARLNNTLSILLVPPIKVVFPLWSVNQVSSFSGSNSIFLFLAPVIPAGFKIIVDSTEMQSSGINYCHWKWKRIASLPAGQNYPIDIYSQWNTIFNQALLYGKRLFFRISILSITSGLLSSSCVVHSDIQNGISSTLGLNWTYNSAVPLIGAINQFVRLDANTFVGVGASPCEILRSVDNAVTWTVVQTLPAYVNARGIVSLGNGVLVVVVNTVGAVFRSIDYGASFSIVAGISDATGFWSVVKDEFGNCYIGSNSSGNIFKSSDLGLTWQLISTVPVVTGVFKLRYVKDGILFCMSKAGGLVYKSYNYGLTWSATNIPTTNTIWADISWGGGDIFLARGATDKKIWRSVDGGINWVSVYSNPAITTQGAISDAFNGVMIATLFSTGRILRSVDYGVNWVDIGLLPTGNQIIYYSWDGDGRLNAAVGGTGKFIFSNP